MDATRKVPGTDGVLASVAMDAMRKVPGTDGVLASAARTPQNECRWRVRPGRWVSTAAGTQGTDALGRQSPTGEGSDVLGRLPSPGSHQHSRQEQWRSRLCSSNSEEASRELEERESPGLCRRTAAGTQGTDALGRQSPAGEGSDVLGRLPSPESSDESERERDCQTVTYFIERSFCSYSVQTERISLSDSSKREIAIRTRSFISIQPYIHIYIYLYTFI